MLRKQLFFIIKRLLYSLAIMLGVIVAVFFLFQGFGDPSRLVMGQRADQATQDNIRRELNLDKPRWKQFLLYLNDVSPIGLHTAKEIDQKQLKGYFIGGDRGDFPGRVRSYFPGGHRKLGIKWPYLNRSYQTGKPVWQILMEALPGTMLLALTAMAFASVAGIFLGVVAAVKKDTWMDSGAVFSSILGISAPSFFTGILIAWIFGFLLSRLTGLQMTGSWFDVDELTGRRYLSLHNLILPALTLGIRPLAIITQLTRSAMLDTLDQDYIRTAYAKGLPRALVIRRHALPNALNPVITAITGWFAELLAGAFFVEYIFGWRGIGKITVDALEKLDFPVVMGSVLISSAFFILVNMLADVIYTLTDPRVGS